MQSSRRLRRFSNCVAALTIPLAFSGATAKSRHAPRTVELTLTAAPARLSLVPGRQTDVFAFNGQVPGPTLEFREGDRVVIHFRNKSGSGGGIIKLS